MIDERLIEYANDLADNCVDWYTQDVDDSYIIDSLKAVVAEQKARDIERGKVFIKDLLLSIIGCEPKEGWIENILNEYEKTLEE